MMECPDYYKGDGNISCSDAMRSMTSSDFLRPMAIWWWMCAFKYLWRWNGKNGITDLQKCIDCVERLINEVKQTEAPLEEEVRRYDP